MGSDEMTSDLPPLQMTPQASVIPNVDSLIGDLLDGWQSHGGIANWKTYARVTCKKLMKDKTKLVYL